MGCAVSDGREKLGVKRRHSGDHIGGSKEDKHMGGGGSGETEEWERLWGSLELYGKVLGMGVGVEDAGRDLNRGVPKVPRVKMSQDLLLQ